MNKLLSMLLGGLIIFTSVFGTMSAFGEEAYSGKSTLNVSNSSVSEEVYGPPIDTLMEDSDYGDDFESATELAINTEIVGQISSSDDIDFFKFTSDANDGEYGIEFSGTGAACINIYDFERYCIDSYSFDSENSYPVNRTFQTNKEYYLEIKSDESDVSYTVSFIKWPDDHGYDRTSSTILTLNEEVAGKINYINDTDYFKFTADKKGMYNIECDGTGVAQLLILRDGKNTINKTITANEGYSYSLNLAANETCYLQIVSSFADVDYRVKMSRELLQNPNFDDNTAGWTLWTASGAVASGSRDTTVYGSDNEPSDDAAYRIDCTLKGSETTHIQLYTSGLKVQEGKKYKLSFMAKSEAGNVEPKIVLMEKNSPWSHYSKVLTVNIGAEWKLYNIYFTSNKTDNNARLTFFLGNRIPEGGRLYFDSLSFKECPDLKENSELLTNPSFSNDEGGWYFWTEGGAVASGIRDLEVYNSAPAGYRVDCTFKGTAKTHIQLYTGEINVKENKRYKLTFRAKSEGGKVTPSIKIMKNNSPWTAYTASKQVSISSDWNIYEVYFDCNTNDSNARLAFFLGNSIPDGGKLYLDSMSLVEVDK